MVYGGVKNTWQVENMASLLQRPEKEVRSLRTTWTPKLLKLQDAHDRTLRDVRLEYARHKDAIQRMADDYFVSCPASQIYANTSDVYGRYNRLAQHFKYLCAVRVKQK